MRVLMCPPEYFDVTYEINAWMRVTEKPDGNRARAQWSNLRAVLHNELGAQVEIVDPQSGLPDMVFTANAGLVLGNTMIPSRFRFAERQGEVAYFNQWFVEHGYTIQDIPVETPGNFEGEGDALFYADLLLAGYRQRSDAICYSTLGTMIDKQVLPLELVDKRWYHLDTCLIALRDDLLAYYPPAFDEYAQRVLENLPGKKIHMNEKDALRFGGNAVVIGDRVAMNSGCETLQHDIEECGFKVFPVDLSEFLKSGGSAKCLTLLLDHPGIG